MKLHFVESMDEVLKIALEREIVALPLAACRSIRLKDRRPSDGREVALALMLEDYRTVMSERPVASGPRSEYPAGSADRTAQFASRVYNWQQPARTVSAPSGLPEIAFLGRSNVGKSSLLNACSEAGKLAFTSSTPGRTQTDSISIAWTGTFYFVDLPGYGYARVPKQTIASSGRS